MNSPTLDFYSGLQSAFDHFNAELFGGALPPCLLTLRSASRAYGYHHAGRFISPDGRQLDELGLHPGFFTLRPVEQVLSTLVHEMTHHWQEHAGTPSRSTPHNKEWVAKMESIGLMPSSTGLPGGKKTGRSVSHYILPGSPFILACRKLTGRGFRLLWLDRHSPEPPEEEITRQLELRAAGIELEMSPAPSTELPEKIGDAPALLLPTPRKAPARIRLICPVCGAQAWTAPGTSLMCGECSLHMTEPGKQGLV